MEKNQETTTKVVETTNEQKVETGKVDETTQTITVNETTDKVDEEITLKPFDDNEEKTKTNKQTQEQNAEFARKRREKEQLETKQKEIEYKAELRGIKKALKGINPYTEKELKTDKDVEMYLIQAEMEAKGLDPNSFSDYQEFTRDKEEKQTTKQAKEEYVAKDTKEFVEKNPNVNIEELFNNKRFQVFAKGKLGNVPLSEIYQDFQEFTKEIDKIATEKANNRLIKAEASPGSAKGTNDTKQTLYSWDEIKKMTPKEINKNWDLVEKSYNEALKQKAKK